jgi:glycosyltransferase involved in cell wall biosynthesis
MTVPRSKSTTSGAGDGGFCGAPRPGEPEASLGVTVLVEQLRRAVPGGIGTYVLGLIKGLIEVDPAERPELTLLAARASRHPDPLAELGLPLQVSYLPSRLFAPALSGTWPKGASLATRSRPGGPSGPGSVKRGRLPRDEVLHATSLLAPPPMGHRLTVTVHDLAWRSFPECFPAHGRRWHEASLRRALRHATRIVVPSSSVSAELVNSPEGVDPSLVVIVPEGSDHLPAPDFDGAQRVLAEIGVSSSYLVSVSTLEPRKNLRRLLSAFGLAQGALPERWPLVVVGPRGWGPGLDPASLRAAFSTAGSSTGDQISRQVRFTGAVTPGVLAALYARARCLAYIPVGEGFGLPPLEAMRAGTPVVTSAVPSVIEAASGQRGERSGSSGVVADPPALVVDPTDVDAIAAALVVAASDEQRRGDLVAAGRSWSAGFTWHDTARRHIALWEQIASMAGKS